VIDRRLGVFLLSIHQLLPLYLFFRFEALSGFRSRPDTKRYEWQDRNY